MLISTIPLNLSGQTTCGISNSCLTFSSPANYKCINGNFTIEQLYTNNNPTGAPILLPPGSAATTAQYVIVNGVITFNQDYIFASNSEIVFLQSAGLDVSAGKELSITESYLHGCSTLWAGINVRPGGRIRLEDNGIEDAFSAVTMEAGSSTTPSGISAVDNRFKKNHIGIRLGNGAAVANINLLSGGISGNDFDGSVDPPSITNPVIPFVCLYGIQLKRVSQITIGNESQGINVFTEYKKVNTSNAFRAAGVYAELSNFTVVNSIFTEIGDPTDTEIGYGIVINNDAVSTNTATIKGLGSGVLSVSTFQDTEGCISIDHGSIDVTNVKTSAIRTGVHYKSSFFGPTPVNVRVDSCYFDQYTGNGIYLDWGFLPVNNLNINNNQFLDVTGVFSPLSNVDRYGVLIDADLPTTIFNNSNITNNTFVNSDKDAQNTYKTGGLFLRNIQKAMISDNDVTDNDSKSTTTKDYTGMRFENCRQLTVRENILTGSTLAYAATKTSAGISVYESGTNLISCNDVNYLRTGIGFEGQNCDATDLVYNAIRNHRSGLRLSADAITGQQKNNRNEWYGTASLEGNFAFVGFNSSSLNDLLFVEMSKFFIRNTDQTSISWANPRSIGGVSDNDYWFQSQAGLPLEDYPCSVTTCCDDTELTKGDERVLQDSFPAYDGYTASTWEAGFRLYRHLNEETGLLSTNAAANTWHTAQSSGNLGKLYTAYRAVENAGPDATQLGQLTTAYNSLSALLVQVAAKDAQIGQLTSTTGEAQLLAQRDSLMNLLISQQTAYNLLDSTVTVQRRTAAATAATTLATMTPANTHERYMKQVLDIQLNLLSTGNVPAEAQTDTLEMIAGQCRYFGGYGVVLARMMVGNAGYVDSTLCSSSARSIGDSDETNPAAGISVLPNPAQDHFVLRVGTAFTQGRLTLVNALGQIVRDENLMGIDTYVNSAGLPAGMYTLSIRIDQQPVQVKKVLISR